MVYTNVCFEKPKKNQKKTILHMFVCLFVFKWYGFPPKLQFYIIDLYPPPIDCAGRPPAPLVNKKL